MSSTIKKSIVLIKRIRVSVCAFRRMNAQTRIYNLSKVSRMQVAYVIYICEDYTCVCGAKATTAMTLMLIKCVSE